MARPTYDKTCPDCGAAFETAYKTSKRCKVCQHLHRMMGIGPDGTKAECWLCDKEFIPRVMKKNQLCGECEAQHRPPAGACKGTCVVTGEKGWILNEDIAVSLPVSTDPRHRKGLIRALIKKQGERRQANGWTAEDAE